MKRVFSCCLLFITLLSLVGFQAHACDTPNACTGNGGGGHNSGHERKDWSNNATGTGFVHPTPDYCNNKHSKECK